MRNIVSSVMLVALAGPHLAAARTDDQRTAQRLQSLEIIRAYHDQSTPAQKVALGAFVAGLVTFGAQVVWVSRAKTAPTLAILVRTQASGALAVLGVLGAVMLDKRYTLVAKDSTLTTPVEFERFMALSPPEQLAYLDANPNLDEFVEGLASRLRISNAGRQP